MEGFFGLNQSVQKPLFTCVVYTTTNNILLMISM